MPAVKKKRLPFKTASFLKQVEQGNRYLTSNLLLTGLLPPVTLII